jgi:glyoxylase-like metal-dependent hydrolase (beta-lactamase superfamily II)
VALLALASCARSIAPLRANGASAVALTAGPNTSLIFLAKTTEGIVAIDLGWWGHEKPLIAALRELGATPDDVVTVFLTHSHRDHIAAWPVVRKARFVLAAAERDRLLGTDQHQGLVPRWADKLKPTRLPRAGEIDLRTFAGDTTYVIGNDTIRAYTVGGHTAGSAAYLVRGVLFLGDAVTYSRLGGFAPAKRVFSDDRKASEESLKRLWARLPSGSVRHVCTAHAHCASFSTRFVADATSSR